MDVQPTQTPIKPAPDISVLDKHTYAEYISIISRNMPKKTIPKWVNQYTEALEYKDVIDAAKRKSDQLFSDFDAIPQNHNNFTSESNYSDYNSSKSLMDVILPITITLFISIAIFWGIRRIMKNYTFDKFVIGGVSVNVHQRVLSALFAILLLCFSIKSYFYDDFNLNKIILPLFISCLLILFAMHGFKKKDL